MPDARREHLVPRAMHVKGGQLADAARAILFRSQPFGAASAQRLFRDGAPYRVGRDHEVLGPFLA